MRYLFTNEILDAVLSASNGDSNYPVRNLQDRFLQKRFQSTGEISQITSLMNTVHDVNCIAQGYTNATSIYSYLYGAGQGIYQAYTNLVTDPTDLTTGNWTKTSGLTAESTSLTINGLPLTKIIDDSSVADSKINQVGIPVTASVKHSASLIIRNESVTDFTDIFMILTGENNQVKITWATKNVASAIASSFDYEWLDDDTIQIWVITAGTSADTTMEFRIDPTNELLDAVIYVTACQFIDNTTTMFPFIDGTHSADVINETFTMPDKFAVRLKINPKFAFDTTDPTKTFFSWFNSLALRLRIYYSESSGTIRVTWQDGGSATLISQQFDDGSSFTDLNQELDIVIFLNLTTIDTSNSMFIVIPQESGPLFQDDVWSAVPDIKSSIFPTLSIGHNGASVQQIDSDYEHLRIYDWDGVKPTITSSDDADTYFSGKTPSFEFEPDSVLFKKSVVHNLNSDTDMTYFDKLAIKQIVTTIEGPDPVYLGGLATGEYYQMPDPEEAFSLPLKDNSHYEQSPSGQVLSNYEKPLIAPAWTFKGVSNEVANEIRSEYTGIGKGTPFYADFFENNRDFYSPIYCFFTAEPGDQKNSRKRDYSVKLLEAR